jgi:hypothetical protein
VLSIQVVDDDPEDPLHLALEARERGEPEHHSHLEVPMSQRMRWIAAGVVVVVVTAPVAFVLFTLGLVVHEAVIWPTAALATAVMAALVASWTADGLARDGSRTVINEVARSNLVWGLIPAGLVLSTALVGTGLPTAVWIAFTLVFTSTVGVVLASRHRTDDPAQTSRGVITVLWLIGLVVAVGVVIFVASLVGLTGT